MVKINTIIIFSPSSGTLSGETMCFLQVHGREECSGLCRLVAGPRLVLRYWQFHLPVPLLISATVNAEKKAHYVLVLLSAHLKGHWVLLPGSVDCLLRIAILEE